MDDFMNVLIGDDSTSNQLVENFKADRKLVLNGEVADWCIEEICMQIMKWNQEDQNIMPEKRKKIYLLINTPGGDAFTGLNMLDIIDCSDTPIVTIGYGMCCSMGFYLLCAGHERYCFPNTVVLLHDGANSIQTTSRKGKDIQAFYDKLDVKLEEYAVKHTNMTHEYIEQVADRELYMFGDEAKEKGIVDKIIGVDCKMNEVLG